MGLLQKIKGFFAKKSVQTAVVASTALVVANVCHADVTSVDALFEAVATDISGVKTGVLSIISILVTVLAVFIGWSYIKRAK
jgi:hydroxymethylpyrimidine/phosphomethylpyrimidine kinase